MNRLKKNIYFYSVNNTTIEQYLSNILTYRLDQNQSEGTVQSVWRYQGRSWYVELELLRTRMDQIPLNTTFSYIYKHHEPFHVIKVS